MTFSSVINGILDCKKIDDDYYFIPRGINSLLKYNFSDACKEVKQLPMGFGKLGTSILCRKNDIWLIDIYSSSIIGYSLDNFLECARYDVKPFISFIQGAFLRDDEIFIFPKCLNEGIAYVSDNGIQIIRCDNDEVSNNSYTIKEYVKCGNDVVGIVEGSDDLYIFNLIRFKSRIVCIGIDAAVTGISFYKKNTVALLSKNTGKVLLFDFEREERIIDVSLDKDVYDRIFCAMDRIWLIPNRESRGIILKNDDKKLMVCDTFPLEHNYTGSRFNFVDSIDDNTVIMWPWKARKGMICRKSDLNIEISSFLIDFVHVPTSILKEEADYGLSDYMKGLVYE